MKATRWGLRVVGGASGVFLIALGLLHLSPTARFFVQSWLVEMDPLIAQTIEQVLGKPYFLHDASDSKRLTVSLSRKTPTRYYRDVLFWLTFSPGAPFVAEAENSNPYGISHMNLRLDTRLYDALSESPNRETICIGNAKAFVLSEPERKVPVYVLQDSKYVLTFVTDDSEKWKRLEHSCANVTARGGQESD